uniref:Exocyst subunit Exo70 family protein n=1 Tax=Heterorhabditis bacteriophora TaxID=37862 RepID=A0A1I7XW57_HETBA
MEKLRYLRSSHSVRRRSNIVDEAMPVSLGLEGDCFQKQDRPDSSARASSRMRCTPSASERGSTRQGSIRQRATFSASVPPIEADLIFGAESCQELVRILERAMSGLELVRNRSDKDRVRAEALASTVDRLRILEADMSRLVAEGGFEDIRGEGSGFAGSSSWAGYQSPRAGTLSVLSDDSFMSAFEEFAVIIDEDGIHRDIVNVNKDQLVFFQSGMEAAANGEVGYRKARMEFCQCDSETDFAAKVWCLRQAFEEVLKDQHRRIWLAKAGRTLLGDILKHSRQDPCQFYNSFDNLMEFFNDEANLKQMEEELASRGVVHFGFWDVVLDFILLDSFEDMKAPPSAIYSVTKNYFLSNSMKYSTISTIVWSMLKAKRKRLKNPNGFIAHFYNISEAVSPAITLGFLGTDGRIGELCQYFKEQITQFVIDVFNTKRVRYTTLQELAEDVWIILQSRTEALQTRLATELIPA